MTKKEKLKRKIESLRDECADLQYDLEIIEASNTFYKRQSQRFFFEMWQRIFDGGLLEFLDELKISYEEGEFDDQSTPYLFLQEAITLGWKTQQPQILLKAPDDEN